MFALITLYETPGGSPSDALSSWLSLALLAVLLVAPNTKIAPCQAVTKGARPIQTMKLTAAAVLLLGAAPAAGYAFVR
jgi:hypothetical protein